MTKQKRLQKPDKEELKSQKIHWSHQQGTTQEKEDKVFSIDGDDAEDGIVLSSPLPAAPALVRGGEITYVPTTQPGAVHVPGISQELWVGDEEQQQERSSPSTSSSTTFDPTPLVNAELVTLPPDHDNRSPVITRSATDAAVSMTHIPAEIFDATPIKPQKEDDDGNTPPRLSELFKNTTIRIMMFVVLCILIGLITGLVMGLSSRQIVIEAAPLSQATSSPTNEIDLVGGGVATLVEPASSETFGFNGSNEEDFTPVPTSENGEANELEEENESSIETNDEDDDKVLNNANGDA